MGTIDRFATILRMRTPWSCFERGPERPSRPAPGFQVRRDVTDSAGPSRKNLRKRFNELAQKCSLLLPVFSILPRREGVKVNRQRFCSIYRRALRVLTVVDDITRVPPSSQSGSRCCWARPGALEQAIVSTESPRCSLPTKVSTSPRKRPMPRVQPQRGKAPHNFAKQAKRRTLTLRPLTESSQYNTPGRRRASPHEVQGL